MLTSGIRTAFLENRRKITSTPGVSRLATASAVPDAHKTEGEASVALTTAANFLARPALATEAFGPFTLVILVENDDEFMACALALEGQLTATVHGNESGLIAAAPLLALLEQKAGRLVVNGFSTGVEVCHAMTHGGPSPATSDPRFTSVGTTALLRFARPVCYQGFPDALPPDALRNINPLGLLRMINGVPTREACSS